MSILARAPAIPKIETPDRLAIDLYQRELDNCVKLLSAYKAVGAPGEQKRLLTRRIDAHKRILRMFEFFEPTTPPNWYQGSFATDWPDDRGWPGLETPAGIWRLRFRGLVPPEVIPRWKQAVKILGVRDDIRVYAPNLGDFELLRGDPIMIGRVTLREGNVYFEIAHWDLAKDLESM